jgi:hypothetical protein
MENLESGNVPQDEEYPADYDDWDRVCSYPCHICGEEDDYDEEEGDEE